jgi:hypothetical protein
MLPPVAFPPPLIFWATAGVAIVTGLTVAAATIPKAATTATAIKRSFEFIGLMKYNILHITLSKKTREQAKVIEESMWGKSVKAFKTPGMP